MFLREKIHSFSRLGDAGNIHGEEKKLMKIAVEKIHEFSLPGKYPLTAKSAENIRFNLGTKCIFVIQHLLILII